jgi:hypothetical protein
MRQVFGQDRINALFCVHLWLRQQRLHRQRAEWHGGRKLADSLVADLGDFETPTTVSNQARRLVEASKDAQRRKARLLRAAQDSYLEARLFRDSGQQKIFERGGAATLTAAS